jgi:acyl transferase domain-containing protein/acyl carrier protein
MSVESNGRHDGSAGARPAVAEDARTETNAIPDGNGRVEAEAIAIIGIGCRFPGGANSPESFWRLMRDGIDAITEVPAERWALPSFYDARPVTPGKINTRWGGFLSQIDHFDANFFNISPREAVRMDPQQRLLLEVTWEALEDAGQVPEKLAGSRSGVFIGMIANEYEDLYFHDPQSVDVYVNTGCARSVASGRLSYALGLQGPSLTVDTACSSSLVAVHLACQSIRTGESELAIAGGVNLLLMPQPSIGWCQANNLAPDGRCKAFDARANGFIRSDGVGVLVLKPLSRAMADGDPIYALIRGSAVNNDGQTSGLLMTPGQKGQEAMLVEAYRNAGVDPAQVQYVEAHGTGTKVGDPTEARALGVVLGAGRAKERPCVIGSVKTNIGHTEGAAGVAGLIKAALSLKHQAIPASLHCEQPNPEIPWDKLPIVVQREFGRWPADSAPAFAGVNSFGISGTNAHIVLQESPRPETNRATPAAEPDAAQLLTLSARSAEALREMAGRYVEFLNTGHEEKRAGHEETAFASYDLAYTAAVRRTHHDYRLASVFQTREELVERLDAYLSEEVRAGLCAGHKSHDDGRSKLVFVLPGQGSQWLGMGRRLLAQEEVFRTTLEDCERAIGRQVEWSLMEVLTSDAARLRLNDIDVIQPALFAVQVALAAQWGEWGIRPDAVVGQSMGEVAAAYIAGALSLDDAAQVICRRSRLLKRMSGLGNMVVVDLSMEQAHQALSGYEDRLSIAVSSSPTSTVLAGNPSALEEIVAKLQRRDIFCRPVKVDVASHSPQMEPLRGELLEALAGLDSRAASVPLYSTVTGLPSDEGMRFQADYWWRNLREPVRFSAVVQQLLGSGHDIFLEISPHPILTGAIQQGMHHFGGGGVALPSLRREEDERSVMLASLGAIYARGYEVEWGKLYPTRGRVVGLPGYAWQGERFWLETTTAATRSRSARNFTAGRDDGHPLLGQLRTDAHSSGAQTWESQIGAAQVSYLYDHRVQGAAVLPAAAYLELALAAARETFGEGTHIVEGFSFKKALFLPEQGERTLQTVVAPGMPGTVSCKIYSLADEGEDGAAEWTLHAAGLLRLAHSADVSPTPSSVEGARAVLEELGARCEEVVESATLYRALHERGLEYGTDFQAVVSLQRGVRETVARLRLPAGGESGATLYQTHPVLLDAGFQALAALLPEATNGETYLPISIDSLKLYAPAGAEAWAHARLTDAGGTDESVLTGDVTLLDGEGKIILEATGLTFQRLEPEARRALEGELSELLYEVRWEARERTAGDAAGESSATDGAGGWLVFAEDEAVAAGVAALLRGNGESCHLVYPGATFRELDNSASEINPSAPEHYAGLMRALRERNARPRGVLYLWGLKPAPESEHSGIIEAAEMNCESVLRLVQAMANTDWEGITPRLWLVTRGTQAAGSNSDPISVAQSPLWGFGRVVASEHPEFRCTLVDLAAAESTQDAPRLFEQLWSAEREDEVALRGDGRYVSKLARYTPRPAARTSAAAKSPASDQPFRVETSARGMLEGLTLRAAPRRAPQAGQVEIEVAATGLNFRDVMKALDIYPGLPEGLPSFGDECAGKVSAVGAGVEGFKVGDEVVAIADYSFATHAVADAELVWPRPRGVSAEVAAGIPIAFGTAAYALEHLGRMRRGERVLIHAATGGVGLAAVQLAQRAGAEIFATAGSDEKRELLRSLGVRHVMDSRSLKFADEVLRLTDGEGVDIVLNSLSGEAITKSLSLLRPFGRFLEIGKRDIYQNANLDLGLLRNSLSFTAVDIAQRWQHEPALIGSLLREVFAAMAQDSLRPLPVRVFGAEAVEDAFRFMAQAKQTGKIVVSMKGRDVSIEARSTDGLFREDASYLITGGLGALGLAVARWMVGRGARHLILMGRSEPTGAAQEAVDALAKGGAQIVTVQADVADLQQVKRALTLDKDKLPPLRGVIHAAGILDDKILLQQDVERFRRVLAPKVSGAWNLHLSTRDATLDFFVLFSSAAALLGSPGQGNYSAANTFLDALAHHRRQLNLPATSINWGPWSEIGLAAQPDRGARLALRGLGSFTPERAVEVLEKLLAEQPVQAAVMQFDLQQWSVSNPPARESSLLSGLAREKAAPAGTGALTSAKSGLVRETVLAAEPRERPAILETYLRGQLARVLGLAPAKLDSRQPLNRLGLDSLMAVELKNRIELDIGVLIPMVRLLQGPSLLQIAEQVAGQLTQGGDARPAPVPVAAPAAPPAQDVSAKVDEMSDEEVEAMLNNIMITTEGRVS